jgi:hypothetical protein
VREFSEFDFDFSFLFLGSFCFSFIHMIGLFKGIGSGTSLESESSSDSESNSDSELQSDSEAQSESGSASDLESYSDAEPEPAPPARHSRLEPPSAPSDRLLRFVRGQLNRLSESTIDGIAKAIAALSADFALAGACRAVLALSR